MQHGHDDDEPVLGQPRSAHRRQLAADPRPIDAAVLGRIACGLDAETAHWSAAERERALEELFARFGRQVVAVSSEDAAQQAWLRARLVGGFRHDNFAAWILRIAKNELAAEERKQSRRRQRLRVFADNDLVRRGDATAADEELDADDQRDEELSRLADCMRRASLRDQQLIRAFFFDQKTYRQLSEELEISSGGVGAALTRARDRLRECMGTSS